MGRMRSAEFAMRRAADAKSKKVREIGAGRRDWDCSAVFAIARGDNQGGAIEKRSARLRTESDPLRIAGQCDVNHCGRKVITWRDRLGAPGTQQRAPPAPLAKGGERRVRRGGTKVIKRHEGDQEGRISR